MVGLQKILKWQFTGTRPKMLTKNELDEVRISTISLNLIQLDSD